MRLHLATKMNPVDDKRRELRRETLLARPVVQECLLRAFLKLTNSPTNFSYQAAMDKLNRVPWEVTDNNVGGLWQNVFWTGDAENGRMITKNRNFAVEYITYLAEGKFDNEEKENLLERYKSLFPEVNKPKSLPSVVE